MVGFDGARGLYADLATGHVPSLAFIAPNQCDDQHGQGNGDAFCQEDPGLTALPGRDRRHAARPESRSIGERRYHGAQARHGHQGLAGLA